MRKLFFILFLLFFTKLIYAQQPAYFILGENQFKGLHIYDIIQDKELNYWIATNEGLYYFNHYKYVKIECENAKSSAVFNFVITKKGTIFCFNLNNQIFKIENKTLNLFYELKTDEIKTDINLSVISDSLLLIGAKKIILISEDGTIKKNFSYKNHYLGPAFKLFNEKTIYHLNSSDSILIISNKSASYAHLHCVNFKLVNNDVLHFFKIKSNYFAISLQTNTIYNFDPNKNELFLSNNDSQLNTKSALRLYSTDNEAWIAGGLPGVYKISSLKNDSLKLIFKDFFISNVYKDLEGNILLSTFDKGIIVVPDVNSPDVVCKNQNGFFTSILYNSKEKLILGASNGKLYSFKNNNLSILNNNGKKAIEHLFQLNGSPLIIFDNGEITAYNTTNNQFNTLCDASLKDVVFVAPFEFYIGTNRGIYKCNWNKTEGYKTEFIPNINYRIYAIAYNPFYQLIYAATSNGLYTINKLGNCHKVYINNKDMYINTLFYKNSKIFATDKKGYIHIIENEKIISTIQLKQQNKTYSFSKLNIYNNTIIAKNANELCQFNLNGDYIKTLTNSKGNKDLRIFDYCFNNDTLWVCNANGIQEIVLNKIFQDTIKPKIFITEIKINDSLKINKTNNFSSNKKKFQFTLISPSILNSNNTFYHYKLQGNDETWSINTYYANEIIYNALAPGNYTFNVFAERQGIVSNTISYSFVINAPFYTKWWFILFLILIFLMIVYKIYNWKLSIQQKKAKQINELNASKLTAIQSQMNPHFIFNSLNSIQDLILKGDVEKSYSYITTFSNLVRRTLSYSDKDFIDFEQEIKLLELYLSLEKLRFKKDFNFNLQTNQIVDIQIPPMLIQPFIENALIHGLLHKEGEKKLSILFELNEILTCKIEDNGIGREKAKAIKIRQRNNHESFSVKAIKKRFDILSETLNGSFGYSYEDIKEDGVVVGTRVTLSIPIKHKF
ncbi:MAG: histidine kinase [Bacteroidetes bacterium]|nr:histidine kinase [Bacteroidota bacterium]